ncbi:hypothetical protein [Metabacillus fastidiosus]
MNQPNVLLNSCVTAQLFFHVFSSLSPIDQEGIVNAYKLINLVHL